MGDIPTGLVIAAILAIVGGPTSAAWIGVRVGMNGFRKDLGECRSDIKELRKEGMGTNTRLAVIETKLNGIPGMWDGKNRRNS